MLKKRRKKARVAIYGASGHAKVVIDVIECQNLFEIACVIDDDAQRKGQQILGYDIIGGKEDLVTVRKRLKIDATIAAIGDNRARSRVVDWLVQNGFDFITAVHPSAVVGRGVTIGAGSVVVGGAVINVDTHVGKHVIINTAATVDHDCALGDFVHIAPGVHLCGSVVVGRGSFICAGATVIPNRTIGANTIVGAGSTVIRDLPAEVTAVGAPAEILKAKQWRT